MLPDYTDLIKTIKQSALSAVEASKPVNVCVGTVTAAAPLKISIDQKLQLCTSQLILCRNVTDYTLNATVTMTTTATDDDDEESEPETTTTVTEQEMAVSNALKAGEKVILLRFQGGQKYVVIDRLG